MSDISQAVHTVTIGTDLEATWLFEDYDDAQAFLKAVEANGRKAVYDEQIILGREDAAQAVVDEADG